ncbi:hypothetical protein CLAFUW4_13529 [Fulvia fulva]|uniref:Uncharacterized protein n=1 Tax=Passalora fulva TaxID=5499 RepID=A0A9Q8UW51_PASFU|nr:uncharacterized protein CLAFUR5_13380 [Fulvia fulva]KAK4610323.1 hypothetical protein CLAFUR4_13531 [Fulvia fulva]KAK4611434.1 hypothetical protein CLAFUR0_13540 [Fulvia fulva]UJO24653.1 hypothetical protein CLAFUR5_13380 [Fulvia fulva]WPV22209.1 hypothetical protein CLAFUW4_13529 [Fulvia fulva]WPV37209.1 hypothetical protein CLAFUW7_13536 [Fulvia fulva]
MYPSKLSYRKDHKPPSLLHCNISRLDKNTLANRQLLQKNVKAPDDVCNISLGDKEHKSEARKRKRSGYECKEEEEKD